MDIDKTNVFLFVTHEINNEILSRYHRLQQEIKDLGEVFLLFHKEEDGNNNCILGDMISSDMTPYIFNIDMLNELDYEPIAETIIPGSNHFATLQFFVDNIEFKYYWVIEYDVVYTGNWSDFFLNFNSLEADFISSHIERYSDSPFWHWWNTLYLEDTKLQQHELIRSFNPIYRISNTALAFLNNLLKGRKNWGHHEVLIPTALKHWGFSILDFGGNGEFVLPQFEEKFYLMPSQYNEGTMRDKPVIKEEELLIENKLLHPVKILEKQNDNEKDKDSSENIGINR